MLEMLDYDLKDSNHKQFADALTLLRGRNFHSDQLKVRFAPWFLVSDQKPAKLRDELLRTGRVMPRDTFFIVSLGKQTSGQSWHTNPSVRRWLSDRGVRSPRRAEGRKRERRKRVVGLSYTLHLGEWQDYSELIRRIRSTFPDSCKPLHAMWFLYTDKPLRAILELIEDAVPVAYWEQHEALVLEIPNRARGAHLGLEEPIASWFGDHGITLEGLPENGEGASVSAVA